MTTQQPPAAWPENVIARYLTLAGSSLGRDDLAVDIIQTQVTDEEEGRYGEKVGDLALVTQCTGCGDREESAYEGLYLDSIGPVLKSFYGEQAREWAQAHAETCRAMPKPEVR